MATERLKITEIFASIQGEADAVGWPSVFVRLTGCPLRCQYCDTAYAFSGGSWFTLDQIIETVTGFGIARVCVTGGEPLAQPNAKLLLTRLADAGFSVSLETSGALSIEAVDPRVSVVLDIKTPGSAELGRNLLANLDWLKASDQIKFVLCDRGDYEYAKTRVLAEQLHHKVMVLFSPVTPGLAPAQLADWIIADALPVRFQLQLHKVLWDDARGR